MAVEVTGVLKNCFLSSASLRVYSVRRRLRNQNAAMWVQMDHRNKEVLLGGEPS
jgi:hypothetical protein